MTVRPADVHDVAALVAEAADRGQHLRLRGAGTKDRLGRRVSDGTDVDLRALSGIVTYEPEELILIARPGTPLAEVEALLASHGQHLAFEPPRWGPEATLGGALGGAWAGPRRWRAGGVRDFVLGTEFVDGRGRVIRAGGRVVKNVTGYDLWRAGVGAFGTLGVYTEICLKLWPRPEAEATLVVAAADRDAGLARLRDWSRRPEEITGLAWQPDDGGRLLARIEGRAVAVLTQVKALRGAAAGGDFLEGAASAALWQDIREASCLRDRPGEALWRLAVAPTQAGPTLDALEPLGAGGCLVDWAGGLLWVSLPRSGPAARVHALVSDAGGCAARVGTGPDDANEAAFTPLAPGVARLNETLRRALDPRRLFNPGRMSTGT